jgi:hypothetical protein
MALVIYDKVSLTWEKPNSSFITGYKLQVNDDDYIDISVEDDSIEFISVPSCNYIYSLYAVYLTGLSEPAICEVNIYEILSLIATVEDNNVSLSWNDSEVLTDELIEFIICRNEVIIST